MIRAAGPEAGSDTQLISKQSSSDKDAIHARVRELVEGFGRGNLGASDDLEATGFTSLDFVNLMLSVEESFALKIPSARMTPANFRTIQAIEDLVHTLQART